MIRETLDLNKPGDFYMIVARSEFMCPGIYNKIYGDSRKKIERLQETFSAF